MNNNRTRKQSRRRRPRRNQSNLALYSRVLGDTTRMHYHSATQLTNTAANVQSGLISLAPVSIGVSLGSICVSFSSMATNFEKYMITRLSLKYDPLLPSTNGAFWSIAFEPRAQSAIAPTTIADAAAGIHTVSGNQITSRTLNFNPSQYFNDWKSCALEADIDDSMCGVLQTFGLNQLASGVGVGLLTVDFDVVFVGLI